MKSWKKLLFVSLLATTSLNIYAQDDQRRFKITPLSEMTPEQRTYFEALMAGPVSGTGSAGVVQGATSLGAPFNVYLRSPVLAEQIDYRFVGCIADVVVGVEFV